MQKKEHSIGSLSTKKGDDCKKKFTEQVQLQLREKRMRTMKLVFAKEQQVDIEKGNKEMVKIVMLEMFLVDEAEKQSVHVDVFT